MGYSPRSIPDPTAPTDIPAAQQRLDQLHLLRKEAHSAMELARMRMLRHSTRKFTPFFPGQLVWLEATNLRTPNRSTKLSPKREGPFPIRTKLSDLVYELELPPQWRIHPVFHASLLSPYSTTPLHGPSFAQPPPEIVNGEEEYEIEAIIAHKGSGARRKYLVKWLGYPTSENQWLPDKELRRNAQELLNEYKQLNRL